MSEVLITSYEDPDIDGTASAIAYAEYLQHKKYTYVPVRFGNINREVQFVSDFLNIPYLPRGEDIISPDSKIILVDTSDTSGLSKMINTGQVIEIIDHRSLNEAFKFPNAHKQIELVGSCATLLAEKFYKDKITVSRKTAVLLYAAIISNTVNFKASVSTERDITMAQWLLRQYPLSKDFIRNMFEYKSSFSKPLSEVFYAELNNYSFGKHQVEIIQLEIIDADIFVQKNLQEIKQILMDIKNEFHKEYIFLTCVDILIGKNYFVCIDHETEKLLSDVLHVTFNNNIASREGILLRKSITPLLKDALEMYS